MELKLVTTVASEVLVSPLPNVPLLRGVPAPTVPGQGASGASGASGQRRDSSAEGSSVGSSGTSFGTVGTAWYDVEAGIESSVSPAPTVTNAWAAKCNADWEALEVYFFLTVYSFLGFFERLKKKRSF